MNYFKLFLPSILLGVCYLFFGIVMHDYIISSISLINLFTLLAYLVLPLMAIIETVRIKRKYFKKNYWQIFYFSMIPGFIFFIDFSYGWFAMGHGYGFINYLGFVFTWGVWIFVVSLLLFGGIGTLIDYIWSMLSRKTQINSTQKNE